MHNGTTAQQQSYNWYISVIDVIEALTGTDRPRKYWNDLKAKLKKEGSQLSEKIGQLKMQSSDGKFYKTDSGRRFIEYYPIATP